MRTHAVIVAALLSAFAPGGAAQSVQGSGTPSDFLAPAWHAAKDIFQNGRTEFFLPWRSWHNRSTYSSEEIQRFSENNSGLGVLRTRREERCATSLYLFAFSDSIRETQWNLGTLKEWFTPSFAGLQLGGGVTALILSRPDVLGGTPVPLALPVASLASRYAALEVTYFPPLPLGGSARGDVWFFFFRLSLPD